MASTTERTPQERETLIFSTPREGREFSERVGEALRQNEVAGLNRQKDIIADQVARQFARTGEGVATIRHPWEHTAAEHAEAQQLVDLAFAQDLWAAVGQARKSAYYPRNLDLFHDVLTNEMYDLLRQRNLQRQSVLPAVFGSALIVVLGLFGMVLLVLFSSR